MKSTLLALAALALMATSALAADYYGTPGAELPNKDCRWLDQAGDIHKPWANCPTGFQVSFGGSPKSFCEMKKNADAKECQSCNRESKKS